VIPWWRYLVASTLGTAALVIVPFVASLLVPGSPFGRATVGVALAPLAFAAAFLATFLVRKVREVLFPATAILTASAAYLLSRLDF